VKWSKKTATVLLAAIFKSEKKEKYSARLQQSQDFTDVTLVTEDERDATYSGWQAHQPGGRIGQETS
jgi:hypothetical protein